MKAEYNFTKGRRGQAVPTKGKTRITIYIDDQILGERAVRESPFWQDRDFAARRLDEFVTAFGRG
jgi:hypothetical protein